LGMTQVLTTVACSETELDANRVGKSGWRYRNIDGFGCSALGREAREPGIQAKRYFICFDRVYGPVSKALSGGSLVAPPAALTISYIRFSEAMSCDSNVAM
jgi:hypothetical protein